MAAANDPLIPWQGLVTMTSVAPICANTKGAAKNEFGTVLFRPRLEPEEPASAIQFLLDRNAYIFNRTSGNDQMYGSGNYRGTRLGGRATETNNIRGTYNFTIDPPGPITKTVEFVTIEGALTNWGGTAGCTVGFKASLHQRPDKNP